MGEPSEFVISNEPIEPSVDDAENDPLPPTAPPPPIGGGGA